MTSRHRTLAGRGDAAHAGIDKTFKNADIQATVAAFGHSEAQRRVERTLHEPAVAAMHARMTAIGLQQDATATLQGGKPAAIRDARKAGAALASDSARRGNGGMPAHDFIVPRMVSPPPPRPH